MTTGLVHADQDEHPPSITVGLRAASELTPRNAALHRNFEQSARDLQRDIVRVVYYLERICHHRVHTTLGFRRIEDYAAAVAGYTPAQTQRLLRMGRRLQRYPDVARALGSGGISFAKAMLICTYTTPQQQRDMVEAARALTVRQLRLQLTASVSPSGDHAVAGLDAGGEVAGAGIVRHGGRTPDGTVEGAEAGPVIDAAPGSKAVECEVPTRSADPAVVPGLAGGGEAEAAGAIDAVNRGAPRPAAVEPEDPVKEHEHGRGGPEHEGGQPPAGFRPAARTVISGAPRLANDPGHYLTLRLTAEQWQRWNSIMDHERRRTGLSPVDIMLCGLTSLRQEPSAGASCVPYLVVMLACPHCGQARLPTREGEIPAPPALVAAAACDAFQEDDTGHRQSNVPPRQRRLALQRARYRCEAPRCRQTRMLEIHHRRPVAAGGTHELDNLLVLCWRCHRRLHEADLAAAESLRKAPA